MLKYITFGDKKSLYLLSHKGHEFKGGEKILKLLTSQEDSIKKKHKKLPKDNTQTELLKIQMCMSSFWSCHLQKNVWRILFENKTLNKFLVYSNHLILFQSFWCTFFFSDIMPLYSFMGHIFSKDYRMKGIIVEHIILLE